MRKLDFIQTNGIWTQVLLITLAWVYSLAHQFGLSLLSSPYKFDLSKEEESAFCCQEGEFLHTYLSSEGGVNLEIYYSGRGIFLPYNYRYLTRENS